MQENLFGVGEAEDGSFRASAAAAAIHTEAETLEELQREILDAILCDFDPGQEPALDPPSSREARTAGPVRIPRDVNSQPHAERLRRHGHSLPLKWEVTCV